MENTFCNTCKVHFITDVKNHCYETNHIKQMTAKDCYELSDGSIARSFSGTRIVCLVCVRVVKIRELNRHINSEVHLNNLCTTKVSVGEMQSPHQYAETVSMNPVLVFVTHIQKKCSSQKQEDPAEGHVLLEFGNRKLVLPYNSWNGIVEYRVTCCVCNDKYILSNAESIEEHCNEHTHIMHMGRKILKPNFIRNITKARLYCMVCKFFGKPARHQERIHYKLHELNLEIARMQATIRAGDGLQVIDCSLYFSKRDFTYMLNVNKTFRTMVNFDRTNKEIVTSSATNSEDATCNGHNVDSGHNCVRSIEKLSVKSEARESTDDDKEFVRNMKTVDSLILSNNEVDSIIGQNSVTVVEFPLKTERDMETAETLSVHIAQKSGTCQGSDKSPIITDEALSAISEGDVKDVAAKETSLDNENTHTSDAFESRTESRHLRTLDVPLELYTDHVEGSRQKKLVELMQTTSRRTNDVFNDDSVTKGVQYCSICKCTLRDEEFVRHNNSDSHKDNLKTVSVSERVVRVLQSLGNDRLSEMHTEESISVDALEDGAKVTACVMENGKMDGLNQIISIPDSQNPHNQIDCTNSEQNKDCLVDANNTNKLKDIQEEDETSFRSPLRPRGVDVTASDMTGNLVTLQIQDKGVHVESSSYHGVYPRPGNGLWCVLCGVTEDDLDNHLLSENHLKSLGKMKFRDLDLIRYLSAFHAHCALCHALILVENLEEHLNSEAHTDKRKSATITSDNGSIRDDYTTTLREFVTPECNNGDSDDENSIDGRIECNANNFKLSYSKNSVQPATFELNTIADNNPQPGAGMEVDGTALKINEPNPCLGTAYYCSVCEVEVSSLHEKHEHQRSLDHGHKLVMQRTTGTKTVNIAPATDQPGIKNYTYDEVMNDVLKSNSIAISPSSLCKLKREFTEYVNARYGKNIEIVNSTSAVVSKGNSGDNVDTNTSWNHSTVNSPSEKVSTVSLHRVDDSVTENLNTKTCIVCKIKVENSLWEEHKKNKKHRDNLKQMMFMTSSVKKAVTLMDKINAIKAESLVRESSVQSNMSPQKASGTENIVLTEAKPRLNNNINCPGLDVQGLSVNEIKTEAQTTHHVTGIKVENVEKTQNQSQSILATQNAVRERSYIRQAPVNTLMQHDFIAFVGESSSCRYLCYLCNAKMSSLNNITQHLNGAKHAMNLELLDNYVSGTTHLNNKDEFVDAGDPNQLFCTICNCQVNKDNVTKHAQKRMHCLKYRIRKANL